MGAMIRPHAMHLSLTAKSAERLRFMADQEGVTRSELIRRLIDAQYSTYPVAVRQGHSLDSGAADQEDS